MPKPRFDREMDSGKSEMTLDVFSHDSTHVRLVIEAEKQSNIARTKALEILNKYSKDFDDENVDKENGKNEDEGRDDGQGVSKSQTSPYTEARNQYIDISNKEVPCDDEDDCGDASQKDGVFDEKFEDLSEEDLEHIARCLKPLSPKGLKKKKNKNISGRFEFKRINNGALAVVKSHDELKIMKSSDASKLPGENENEAKEERRGRRFSLKHRKASRRARSRSRASRDFDSGIHTDDACLQNMDEQTVKDSSKLKMNVKPSQPVLNKEIKKGDLPPKPNVKPKEKIKRDGSVEAPSSRATVSDADIEEIISVVSSMSSLSEKSVAEKMKERGPIVLTQAMLETAVIPDMICLKKNVKLTKMQVLKRKLSFSKGKI